MSAEKKMNDRKVIGTHDGKFHCDEVLACAMLKLLPVDFWKFIYNHNFFRSLPFCF